MPEALPQVRVSGDQIATVTWSGAASPEQLQQAIRSAAEQALRQGVRRLELAVSADDPGTRRAVQRAGFRLEGVRRGAQFESEGHWSDVLLFARLDSDEVGGPIGFSGVMNASLPKKRLIAHVLMRDVEGRVLLCETRFKQDWELPGGVVEPGEPPREGAVREVREELGLDLAVGRMLVADWMPPYLGWEDAIEMIFDGGRVTEDQLAGFVLQPSEIRRVKLCTLDEAAGLVTPIAHRRLALAARLGPAEMAYTEDGAPPADVP